jgi:hypothetical protein
MGLMDDDDFKISMDDIKDMVSELYGEKIEKVEASKARSVLREFTEAFLAKGIDEVSTEKLTNEEEGLLAQYEKEHEGREQAPVPEPAADEPKPLPDLSVDVEALKRRVEEETRKKLEAEMREKIKQELTDEKQKKKEEILKKIEQSKMQSAAEAAAAAAAAPAGLTTNYSEKMNLINMFEQSQKMLALLLSKLMRRNPVDTMFLKTLEKAMEKFQDVLKKVDCNQYGKVRTDGSIEVARLAANLNAMYMPEGKKTEKFLNALKDIFEERLIAVELALGIETKDEILSNLLMQAEKVFSKKEYQQRLRDIFNEYIIPDTTLKQGG